MSNSLKTYRSTLTSKGSRRRRTPLLVLLLISLLSHTISPACAQRAQIEPEASTGYQPKTQSVAKRHMVAAAHPLAVAAGLEMLRSGGTAIDAAIATQLVLGLVEPQSSGLGGGAFLLNWSSKKRALSSYDGRETAPAAAKPDRFPTDRPFDDLVGSGLSIGVPGVPRLLEAAHRAHGRLTWRRLFKPAIRLAEKGFPITPRLYSLLRDMGPARFQPGSRAYFFKADGTPWPVGHRLTNPEYASTLKLLASRGADAFYTGPLADTIIAAARGVAQTPSDITHDDLARYRVKVRPPVCFAYRTRRICSMGPPSSGGIALGQILGLLQAYDLGAREGNIQSMHLVAEAEKLAYADRDRYLADPDAIAVPGGLLDPTYLDQRRTLIVRDRAMSRPPAGLPPGLDRRARGEDTTLEIAGTSHISVLDGEGNAVAMTSTIEASFGSRVWAAGFLLNNQLTDFSIRPTDKEGLPLANAVGPGKRPRSSMAPTIVFDHRGRVEAVLGSPGGSRIILYVAKALAGR